jgi:DNA-binding NtrC family response regulator
MMNERKAMKTMTTKNVLICEDDPVQMKILTTLVRQAGYTSLEARTPSEAIIAARRCGIDAVLTDVQLQDGNAFELIGDLRRVGVDAPFMMGSACATDGMKARAREAGAKYFFEKPFDLPKIREQVDRILQGAGTLNAVALIVESHDGTRKDLEKAAIQAGFKVLAVENGVKALDLIANGNDKIELLLTDLHADGASGASLIQKAKVCSPDLHVIMMSGDANRDEIREGYEAGAASLIRKPIAGERLQSFLKDSLKLARAEQKRNAAKREEARKMAARPITQRWVIKAVDQSRKSKRGLVIGATLAAALLIGIATAVLTQKSYVAADRAEAQMERMMNLQERMATGPAGAKMDASVSRFQAGEQIRLMSEANNVTRNYYEGQLQEMRRQNSQTPVAAPEVKPAARK